MFTQKHIAAALDNELLVECLTGRSHFSTFLEFQKLPLLCCSFNFKKIMPLVLYVQQKKFTTISLILENIS